MTFQEFLNVSWCVREARDLAQKIHNNHFRKSGEPYFNHLERVAERAYDLAAKYIGDIVKCNDYVIDDIEEIIEAAYLHDSREDHKITEEKLFNQMGERTSCLVNLLTRNNKTEYDDYICKIAQGSNADFHRLSAKLIKLADLEDNLSDLERGHKRSKYILAHHLILSSLDK